MIITYLKQNELVVSIIMGFPVVWEENNQLLIKGGLHPLLNNLTQADWGYYKDKHIVREYDESDNEIPLYLGNLALEPIGIEDLPVSEHIGKLIAVNPALAKPATVRRRFMGRDFDINCLVTQNIVNMWTSNPKQLNIDDFVLVSFIEEIPNETERNVAIVTDKVYQSW